MTSAIISAAIALIIFTLSQVFVHLRDRQTHLRSKLEELFEALNSISEKIVSTYYGAQTYKDGGDSEALVATAKEINKALYRPRTLILLYFPYLVKPWEMFFVKDINDYIAYINNAIDGDDVIDPEKCFRFIQEFSLKIRFLQDFIANNVEFSTQSISFHARRIITGKVELKFKPNKSQERTE